MTCDMKKNKSRDEYIGYEGAGFAILNGAVREGIVKKVRFQERAKGGEGVNHLAIWRKNHPGRWNVQRP